MPTDVQWRRFDYADKKRTAPPVGDLVWIVEEFYTEGVTLGYFDGFTMFTWAGSDDCSVSWWAPIEYPASPEETEEEVDAGLAEGEPVEVTGPEETDR